MAENKVTVRGWELDDFFDLLEIYDKLDITFDTNAFKGMDNKAIQNYMTNQALRKLPKVRTEVYTLIASLTGSTVEEIRKKGIKFLMDLITDLLKDINFTDAVAQVFTQEPTE